MVKISYGKKADFLLDLVIGQREKETFHEDCLLDNREIDNERDYGQSVFHIAEKVSECFSTTTTEGGTK